LSNASPQQHSLSNYSQDAIASLTEKLAVVMRDDKLYLDPELTLGKLSRSIETTDKKLSTLFNTYLDTTFYDYVNSFRIVEVKKAIQSVDSSKYTLLSLALDCGFNSKASFNRVFKKETGLSPSQYRKEYVNHSVETSY
jgi:AraC-like DNA-binding protein